MGRVTSDLVVSEHDSDFISLLAEMAVYWDLHLNGQVSESLQ